MQSIREIVKSPLRILQLSSAQSFGGGERYLADLANSLTRRGHSVHVALRPKSAIGSALYSVPAKNVTRLALRNALDARTTRALSHLVRTNEIEIIHAHMARDYSLACYAASRNPGARLIVTRHVLFPLSPLHRIPFAYVDRIIAVSQAVAKSLRKQSLVSEEKIKVIPNGVVLSKFEGPKDRVARSNYCSWLGIPDDSLLIGIVAELKQLKGHEEFLRAARVVIRKFPQSHFIIVGSDPSRREDYRSVLERLIIDLGLDGHVHLTGWLEDVAPLLKAFDLFVSASRSESFGLAIVEAMASGTPVVATDTEGAREIIQDGETGVLTPINDFSSLAEGMTELLSDPEKSDRLSRTASETVRARFSIEKMVESTEKLYHECQAARAGRP